MIIISYFHAKELINAFNKRLNHAKVYLDLGISLNDVKIADDKFFFPDGQYISLEELNRITKAANSCFFIKDNKPKKIQLYSHKTKKFYKLYPTGINTAPTVEISGIRMHAVKNTDPYKDAKEKVNALKPIKGYVLDTCFGLGYTAIIAGKYAKVYTYEIDENIIEIARYNPWSKEVFRNKNIELTVGDICKEIKNIPDKYFDRIIHDPPSFKICAELYSEEFYRQLYRVLKPRGKLYHYIGSPGSKKGVNIEKGVLARLRNVGFGFVRKAVNGVVMK